VSPIYKNQQHVRWNQQNQLRGAGGLTTRSVPCVP